MGQVAVVAQSQRMMHCKNMIDPMSLVRPDLHSPTGELLLEAFSKGTKPMERSKASLNV